MDEVWICVSSERRPASIDSAVAHWQSQAREEPVGASDHLLGALEVEAEAHLGEARMTHRMAEAFLLVGVEHEKAAATRADELSPERAIRHREIIPLVDLRIAHPARALLFVLPV